MKKIAKIKLALQMSPQMLAALLGAGVGGLGGAASGLVSKKDKGRKALTRGLLGALLGGAAGYGLNRWLGNSEPGSAIAGVRKSELPESVRRQIDIGGTRLGPPSTIPFESSRDSFSMAPKTLSGKVPTQLNRSGVRRQNTAPPNVAADIHNSLNIPSTAQAMLGGETGSRVVDRNKILDVSRGYADELAKARQRYEELGGEVGPLSRILGSPNEALAERARLQADIPVLEQLAEEHRARSRFAPLITAEKPSRMLFSAPSQTEQLGGSFQRNWAHQTGGW